MKVLKQYYSKLDKENKDNLEKAKTYPIPTQRIIYNIRFNSLQYQYIELAEDENKYVITKSLVAPCISNIGNIYSKRTTDIGITIHKKGRKSERVKIWYNKKPVDTIALAFKYLEYFNMDETNDLLSKFNHYSVYCILTKGIYSNILCGNFKTINDCINHYCKYSLKYIKLNELSKDLLFDYIKDIGDGYKALTMIKTSYLPNEFLKNYKSNIKLLHKTQSDFYTNLLTLNKKVYINDKDQGVDTNNFVNSYWDHDSSGVYLWRYKVEKLLNWFDKGFIHQTYNTVTIDYNTEPLPF